MAGRSQRSFEGFREPTRSDFGGSLLGKAHGRSVRPLSFKRPLHLVLRSSRATGARSFLSPRYAQEIEAIVRRTARRQGLRVYRYANSGNHLHLIIRARSQRAYHAYLRVVPGLIARLVLEVERGRGKATRLELVRRAKDVVNSTAPATPAGSKASPPRFWDALPFTRIIAWGRDYLRACDYVLQNKLEALGFMAYRPRGRAKKKLKSHLSGDASNSPPGPRRKSFRRTHAPSRR